MTTTQTLKHKYIDKGIKMELTKQQLVVKLSKTEMSTIIAEALADAEANAGIKKVLNPFLSGKFVDFPEFTNITLGETAEDGSVEVSLKKPVVRKAKEEAVVETDTSSEEL